jgi:hypothetical protein
MRLLSHAVRAERRTLLTQLALARRRAISAPVRASQIRVLSADAVTIRLPSGLNPAFFTTLTCQKGVRRFVCVAFKRPLPEGAGKRSAVAAVSFPLWLKTRLGRAYSYRA